MRNYLLTALTILGAVSAKSQIKPNNAATAPSPTVTVAPTPGAYMTGMPVNYTRSWEPAIPLQNEADVISTSRTVREVKQATGYFDGLGRPVQTVVKGMAPGGYDMVTMSLYDEFGREGYKYLPYVATAGTGTFKPDPFADQQAFYSNTNTNNPLYGQGEQVFYGQTVFEPSPMNRPTKTLAPGNSWAGSNKGTSLNYELNTYPEVIIWTIGMGAGTQPVSLDYYGAGQLDRLITVDENGKRVVEYKDKSGLVVLKKIEVSQNSAAVLTSHTGWLCTYYLYDALNRLRFVFPPKATEWLVTNNWPVLSTTAALTMMSELCFRYDYDYRSRMSVKKVPGAGEVYMVYDQRDRLVMMQDANLRLQSKWMVTLYDVLNRPLATGLVNNSTVNSYSFAQHATAANTSSAYPFTVSTQPGSGWELLTQTYYDDYSWVPSGISGISATLNTAYTGSADYISSFNTAPDYAQAVVQSSAVKGMVTGSKVKVLETSIWLYTVTFYDDKGRPIQKKATNIDGGYDYMTTQYDFSGKVLRTHQYQWHPAAGIKQLLTKHSYDDAGRLTGIKKKINGGTEKTISQLSYDALGQLKQKQLGTKPNTTSTPLATADYNYNIRGWLTGINKDYAGATGSQGDRYFGMELSYDRGFTQSQLNGNIAGIKWRSEGDKEQRAYGFAYDAANRLMKGDFIQYNGTNWATSTKVNFSMQMGDGIDPTTAYDGNGNIKRMQQYGMKGGVSNVIDDLYYTYQSNSNKLQNVIDKQNDPNTTLGDFRTASSHPQLTAKNSYVPGTTIPTNPAGITDYTYDGNGNMVTDENKGITGITYNHLNLPSFITTLKGNIAYVYDATGNKLKKVVVEVLNQGSDMKLTHTYYMAGMVYEIIEFHDGITSTVTYSPIKLLHISHEEGRIREMLDENGLVMNYAFDYMLKDHLGNIRSLITEEQRQDIYPAATLEGDINTNTDAAYVEKGYYTIDPDNILDQSDATGIPIYDNNNGISNPNPNSATTSQSDKLYRLKGDNPTTATGLGITLKVMAGDKIDIHGKSYYFDAHDPNNNTPIPASDIIYGLFGTAVVGSGYSNPHGAADDLMSGNGSPVSLLGSGLLTGQDNDYTGDDSKPKAYINWILFNDQLQYVDGGFSRVGDQNDIKDHYSDLQNIAMAKNGYLYIYCSNESNEEVFFDNLQVVHTRGSLLEENHYYPFGLTMAGISSRGAGSQNKIKLFSKEIQSNEFTDGSGLEWYDYGMREYDQQVGRFFRIDPIAEKFLELTPYQYCSNDPIKNVDLDGAEGIDFRLLGKLAGKTAAHIIKNPNGATAKVMGAATGITGAVVNVVEGGVNLARDPSQVIQGIKHIMSQSPIEFSVNYAMSLYSKYGNSGSASFTEYAMAFHVFTDIAMALSPMKNAVAGKTASVWELAPSKRGFAIEEMLGGNLPKSFPIIDKLVNGVATSIKSIDLTASSYLQGKNLFNTLKGYINKLDNFEGASWGNKTITEGVDFTSKALQVAIQPGKATLQQWEQIGEAMKYANDHNIQLNLQFVK
ncbi:DUF6443 domain-containing protein [Mucilaginibacter defluvii]|uniref:RHS repeat-associated protein n=1 Tax=Mucilaginibacter defluvii TaxID=1196019 RepID=A0ABP9G833_9SPHI